MELIVPNISKTLFFPVFQLVRDIHSGLDSKRNVRTIKSGIISDMEIVTTNTKDGIILHGQLFESPNKENIIIHIHGMSGDLYLNSFYPAMEKNYPENGWSFLTT